MLPRKLRKQLKKFDYVNHPECSHNWVHNAGMQCEWDEPSFGEVIASKKHRKDSNNVAYMYICTMCGGTFWSSEKMFDIPHYRVRGVVNDDRRKCNSKTN